MDTKVNCSSCGKPLENGQLIVDQEIYKCGELDFIELFHRDCEPQFDTPDRPAVAKSW